MKTKNPFFAKSQVKFYCDDTEPKLYPHAFDEYIVKSEVDAALFAKDEVIKKLRDALEQIRLGIEPESFAYDESLQDHLHKCFTGVTAAKYADKILKEVFKDIGGSGES